MKLEDMEQIIDGMCVFMPSGLEAELSMDSEGNVYAKYADQCVDTYTQDEFGNIIKEGIVVFNPLSIAQQSVLMESEQDNKYIDAVYKKLDKLELAKEADNIFTTNIYDDDWKIEVDTDSITISLLNKQDKSKVDRTYTFPVTNKEQADMVIKRLDMFKKVTGLYECKMCDAQKLFKIALASKDMQIRQQATSLLDKMNLGLDVKDEVDKLFKKLEKQESLHEKVEITKNYKRTRLAEPNTCKSGSFRTKQVNKKGDKIVMCKDKKTNKMKAQSKLQKLERRDTQMNNLKSLKENLTRFMNEINDDTVENTYLARVTQFDSLLQKEEELYNAYNEARKEFKQTSVLEDEQKFDSAKAKMWEAFRAWLEAVIKTMNPEEFKANIELTVGREFRLADKSRGKNESLNEELQYGVEYRNMHNGIHNLIVTDSRENAEKILSYLIELENLDTTIYDEDEIEHQIYFFWDEINRLANTSFEVNYRDTEASNGTYDGIEIINYADAKPDIYESLNEDDSMLTDINDIDFPDALADTVETTEDGEVLTLSKVVDEIKDMKDEIVNAVDDVKDEIKDMKDTNNIEKENDDEFLNKLDDDIEELQDELDNNENQEPEEELEESYKKYLRKGQYEDLNKTKQEIDKAVRNGENVENIKNDIVLNSENDEEEKAAKEYASQKLKENLLNTKYTSKIQL